MNDTESVCPCGLFYSIEQPACSALKRRTVVIFNIDVDGDVGAGFINKTITVISRCSMPMPQKRSLYGRQKMSLSMCRACLVLFGEQDERYDLIKDEELGIKFLECTSTLVYDVDEDDMPQCICDSCCQLLRRFHDFQLMCAESMQNFKLLLSETLEEDYGKSEGWRAGEEQKLTQHKDTEIETEKLQQTEANSCLEGMEIIKEDAYAGIIATTTIQTDARVGTEPAELIEIEEVLIVTEPKIATSQEPEEIICKKDLQPLYSKRNRLACAICTQRFYKSVLLEAHMLQHQGQRPYLCVVCDKSYARQSSLSEHIKANHADTQIVFKCQYDGCDRVYKSTRSLNYHTKNQHGGNKRKATAKKFICEKCGKSFSHQMFLQRHRFVHLDKSERPYGCSQCEKRFYTKQTMLNHLNRHNKVKPYSCQKCGVKVISCAELKTHMNTHTRLKSWHCKDCNKSFNNSSNFNNHKRVVHERDRRFPCSVCEERFAKREHLRNHEMRHTGERPYQCEPCGKGYIQLSAFKSHMRTQHGKYSDNDRAEDE